MISVRVLDDHMNTRINHIKYYLTKGLIIFWNWILEIKMHEKHLYYLFFHCFNFFYYNFTGFFILHRCVIFPGSFKNPPFGSFVSISQKLQVSQTFWSMIWKPDKISFPLIGVTCMYCKNWQRNGHFCGVNVFLHPLDRLTELKPDR